MQLAAPRATASSPVVMPLPPTDFRVASTSLARVASTAIAFGSSAESLANAVSDSILSDYIPERRAQLNADAASLPDAIGQARRAVNLLVASRVADAGAFAGAINEDVLGPLERAVHALPASYDGVDGPALHMIAQAFKTVGSAASSWAAELGRTPTVVVPPMVQS